MIIREAKVVAIYRNAMQCSVDTYVYKYIAGADSTLRLLFEVSPCLLWALETQVKLWLMLLW